MRFSRAAALAATVTTASAQAVGFNYGSTLASGAGKTQADFQNEFTVAQNLVGGPGASSARLYTMVQGGTAHDPISAIPAAIATNTRLLLGLWASAGQDSFNNELAALTAAIQQYGSAFANLVDGISVGSEDLYRTSVTGIANKAGVGATPDTLVTYIGEVRNVISSTILSSKLVGHVDTWNDFVNGSNAAVINAVDFLGVDAYPYFETTTANSIENGNTRFFDALNQVRNVAGGKKVMVTETGWPLAGPVSGQAVASVANAKTYWDSVGCSLFGNVDTYWYTLYDGTPSPSFGIVGSTLSTTPLFDLTCPAAASSSVASSASAATSTQQQNQATGTTLATVVKPSTTDAAPTTTAAAAGTTAVAAGTTTAAAGTTTVAKVSQISDGQVQAGTQTQTYAVTTATAAATSSQDCETSAQVTTQTQTQVAATPVSTGTSAPAQPSAKSCPAALSGVWEYPHLIVPVDKNQPSAAAGTSYFGTFNDHVSTTFNFDLPASYAGKTCSLVFLFPTQDQLTTSSYTFSGQGGLDVYELSSPVTESTSYSSVPSGVKLASIPDVKPGNSYTVASHECAAGQRVSFEFEATGSLALNYFQDYNPSPIGAYITVC